MFLGREEKKVIKTLLIIWIEVMDMLPLIYQNENNTKMRQSKIQIGAKVISAKFGNGIITKIITKSTGYVEVDYNGMIKKEMAFNLTDENGESMKAKPVHKPLTEEQKAKRDREHARFMKSMNDAVLADNFLPSQIASGNYNRNLIR